MKRSETSAEHLFSSPLGLLIAMVLVTRCPYCGAVWMLPDRETAERGPVKCSECQHSFDATSDMLQVPEQLFPNMPKPRIRPPQRLLHAHETKVSADAATAPSVSPSAHPESQAQQAPSPAPVAQTADAAPAVVGTPANDARQNVSVPLTNQASSVETPQPLQTAFVRTDSSAPVADLTSAGSPADTANPFEAPLKSAASESESHNTPTGENADASTPQTPALTEPRSSSIENQQASASILINTPPHKHGVLLHGANTVNTGLKVPAADVGKLESLHAMPGAKTEPRLSALPTSGLSKLEPHFTGASPKTQEVSAESSLKEGEIGAIIPSQAKEAPKDVRLIMAPAHEAGRAEARANRAAAIASVATAVILLLLLAAVLSVVFNQRIIKAFPQTQEIFTQVCGNVPCPGFYLADASAYDITRSNLRAVDESGNYLLEITVINKSNFAQAVPSLDIVLVDDVDTPLMRRTLHPEDYLSNPMETESIAPGRSMSVRFSLQTNVTPARCVVTPVFAEKNN